MKQVLRYLIATQNYGLLLPSRGKDIELQSWSDADWACDHHTRKSRSGYLVCVNEALIQWRSKLLSSAAMATAEAEFY